MNKLLSVIMPVYNAEQWIAEAIESVLNQTYSNWELLCVDDGSKDRSREIVREYEKKDSRVILLEKENGGVSSARNYGLDHAKGDYVAFLDADDIALPEMYETLISLLESEDSDCSFCAFTRFFTSGKRLTTIEKSFSALKENPQDIKFFFYSTPAQVDGDVLYTDDIHGSSCRSIFKKKLLQDNHVMFPEGIRFSEDQIFVVAYLQHCRKISYTDKPLLLYRAQTKKWAHHNLYDSHMKMLSCQLDLVEKNQFYSKQEKAELAAYLKYSVYMMVINDDLMFKLDAHAVIASYPEEFHRLLTARGLYEKMRLNINFKKIILFILLKLRMFKTVQRIFPNKRY